MWYFVAVKDRITEHVVTVGSMLTHDEAKEIIRFLEKYNSTDFMIIKGVEKI